MSKISYMKSIIHVYKVANQQRKTRTGIPDKQ